MFASKGYLNRAPKKVIRGRLNPADTLGVTKFITIINMNLVALVVLLKPDLCFQQIHPS